VNEIQTNQLADKEEGIRWSSNSTLAFVALV